MRRVYALIRKEGLQIMRDPSALLIAVFLPFLLLFLYGYGVSLDLNHLRIGVCMEDTAPDAQSFVQSLRDSRYFEIQMDTRREPLYALLEKGEIRGIVVIPAYFSSFRKNPNLIAPLQVIADGSEANTANFVQYYVEGAFQTWLAEEALNHPGSKQGSQIFIQPRFWYNEALESRFFLLSGALGIIMTLIGALLTALVVAREWERGTMEALMSTEVKMWEVIIGKLVPYFVLGMISMAICVLVSVGYYGLPLRGSLLALFLTSAMFLICALGMGFLISVCTKVQVIASQITIVIAFLPAYILSGFLFEIGSMPLPIRCLTYVMPARYFVQSLQTLFMTGNVWSLLLPNIGILFGFALILFAITSKKMVKQL